MWRKQSVWIIPLLVIHLFLLCTVTEAAPAKKSTSLPPSRTAAKVPVKQHSAPPVRIGDPKIKHLQQLLANTGFYPGSMTGVLDVSTKEAITLAQKTWKLKQTGKYDQKLIGVLTEEAKIEPKNYRKKLVMKATAYTSQDPGCGNLTKREHLLRKGLVAVDPKVVPLGTRLYIEGYGYAIADDIGSAIKGATIDLAYETRNEAFRFGRKTITVFVL